jgi:hypothetical protein
MEALLKLEVPKRDAVIPPNILIDPVTNREPLIIALPVNGNALVEVPPAKANEAVVELNEVFANELVKLYEALVEVFANELVPK